LSQNGEFLVTVHQGYASTSGRLNENLFKDLATAVRGHLPALPKRNPSRSEPVTRSRMLSNGISAPSGLQSSQDYFVVLFVVSRGHLDGLAVIAEAVKLHEATKTFVFLVPLMSRPPTSCGTGHPPSGEFGYRISDGVVIIK
jgi:hypothetical protein